MTNFLFSASLVLGFLALICFYRVAVGPSAIDRMISINVVGTKVVVILALVGACRQELEVFLDVALVYASISFLATVGLALYLTKGSLYQGR